MMQFCVSSMLLLSWYPIAQGFFWSLWFSHYKTDIFTGQSGQCGHLISLPEPPNVRGPVTISLS